MNVHNWPPKGYIPEFRNIYFLLNCTIFASLKYKKLLKRERNVIRALYFHERLSYFLCLHYTSSITNLISKKKNPGNFITKLKMVFVYTNVCLQVQKNALGSAKPFPTIQNIPKSLFPSFTPPLLLVVMKE